MSGLDCAPDSILCSNFFLNTILSFNPRYQYWYVIPGLMRVNRELRNKIISNIPGPVAMMFKILGSGRPRGCSGFGIYSLINCRETLTKLYITGVLSEYLRFYNALYGINSGQYHWTVLSTIPVHTTRSYNDYIKLLPAPTQIKGLSMRFPRCDGSGSRPQSVLNFLLTKSGAELILRDSDRIISCSWYMNYTHCVNYKIIKPYTCAWSQLPTVPEASKICELENSISYANYELPVPGTTLNTYLCVILDKQNWNDKIHNQFYKMFAPDHITGAVIKPDRVTGAVIKPDHVTGEWDLLFFCALFDLDLSIMAPVLL